MVYSIGEVLQQWAEMDIFFYALPFLLIFALVFAVLQKLNLTGKENRGIDAVIALVVGLLALQFDKVPIFFQTIFPNVGIGLAVILVALITMGLFVNPSKHQGAVWTFFAIGGVVAIFILLNSFEEYSWWTGSFWQDNISAIVAGIVIIVFIVVVVSSGKEKGSSGKSPFFLNVDTEGK